MGCPNYFKFHPEATIQDYMERFKVESYDQAIKEIKSFDLDPQTESRILGYENNNQFEMKREEYGQELKENTRTERSRESDYMGESEESKRQIDGHYVNRINKMLNKIYEDPDMDERERREMVDILYGQLKAVTSYKDPEESPAEEDGDEELTTEEKLERIKEMMKEIQKTRNSMIKISDFMESSFESQLMDLEQFDFFQKI